MPPTPIIGNFPFEIFLTIRITSLLLLLSGRPLNPPDCLVRDSFESKLSLFRVVFVQIIPSNFKLRDNFTIFLISLLFRSGEILIRIGFFDLDAFSLNKGIKISSNFFVFCNSLRLGVFGELTLIAK